MAFWLTFFLFIGFTVIGELLRPKPKFDAPQPSGLGDFQVPTAQEGRPIPAVFGTVRLKGPNVVWYGDLVVSAIKKKVKTGIFSSTEVTTGYRYNLGQQLVLCHGPIDALLDVRFDDRAVPAGTRLTSRPTTSFSVSVWRGQDGGGVSPGPGLDTYIDEPAGGPVGLGGFGGGGANDLDYIHYIVPGSVGAATNINMLGIATPPPGARHFLRVRARKVQAKTDGNQNQTGDWSITGFGGLSVPTFQVALNRYWKTYQHELTPAQIATITNYGAGGVVVLSSSGLPGPTFDLQVSWMEFLVTSDTGQAPDAWDSSGKMVLFINQPNQFGGEEREGGVVGTFDVYRGSLVQTANDYLVSKIGVPLPGYRGICYVVQRGAYVGNSAYLKLMSFTVRRLPNGLGLTGGKHDVNGDANIACVVYDILTDPRWGCGISSALIDVPSFLAAGETTFAEGLGVSMSVDSQASARDLIAEVLRHADGTLYVDPSTGLLRLALARGDYQVQDLPLLDESNVRSVKFSRPSWEQLTNVVNVRYIDRAANFTPRVATAQDLANIEARGGEVSEEEFGFLGLSNAAAAQRTAARVLRTVAYPLAPLEIVANRDAWQQRPAGLFRLRWAAYEIEDMPCRVIRLRDGDLRDGAITIDAVEDVFGILWTAYSTPPGSEWVDPVTEPGSLAASLLVECPFALVVGESRVVLSLGAAGTGTPVGYQVWSDPVAQNYALTNVVNALTPSGVLVGSAPGVGINRADIGFVVTTGPGMDALASPDDTEFAQGGSVLMIDDEMMAWGSLTNNGDGTYTFSSVVRGVMDTVPANHLAGARVWFISEGAGVVQAIPYPTEVTVRAKLLPFNSAGIQELQDATEVSVTTDRRAVRPYPPGQVLVNGGNYPNFIVGNITVSWVHRDRLGSWTYDNGGETASPESGVTYTLRFYGEDGLLKRTYSGLTGLSQEWTTEVADSGFGRLNNVLRFELEAIQATGSILSRQRINVTVWRDILPPMFEKSTLAIAARRSRRPVVRVRSADAPE